MDALQCPTEVLFNSRFSISVKFGCQALQFRDEVIVVLELNDSVKIEMFVEVRASPVDRNRLRDKAVDYLLGVVSRVAAVLWHDAEHVGFQYRALVVDDWRTTMLPHGDVRHAKDAVVNLLPQDVPR